MKKLFTSWTTAELIAMHGAPHSDRVHDTVEDILVHRAAYHEDEAAMAYLEGFFGIKSDA